MKRKVLAIGGLVGVVLIVAVGAFTAVQLIAAQRAAADLPPGAMVFEDVTDDGSGNPVTVKTIILPAVELPQRPSEAGGILKRQEDNSYFVGTGSVSVSVQVIDGESSTAVEHSGPEVEIVTNRDTQFYQDVTRVDFTASESKEQTLQQEIRLVDRPETMPDGAEMQVWGEKRGDRVIAEVIVFSGPR